MTYSIDRLADFYAVCISETGEKRLIPLNLIDGGAAEGALLTETAQGRFLRDPALELEARRRLHAAAEALFDSSKSKS